MKIMPFVSKQKYELVFTMQNISYFFSLQNEKYPVTKVSCNKGAEPGGKTETFLLFTLLNFKYLSNVAPQLTAAAFPWPFRRLPAGPKETGRTQGPDGVFSKDPFSPNRSKVGLPNRGGDAFA